MKKVSQSNRWKHRSFWITFLRYRFTRQSLLLAFTCLFCQSGYSYSVPNHKSLTQWAVDLARHCAKNDSTITRGYWFTDDSTTTTLSNSAIEFNVSQDKPWYKKNLWHFPADADGLHRRLATGADFAPYAWMITSTGFTEFTPFVHYLARTATLYNNDANLFRAIGALSHFVQDMAVPAHAIPIFHPIGAFGTDKFDDFPLVDIHSRLSKELMEEHTVCQQVLSTSPPSTVTVDMQDLHTSVSEGRAFINIARKKCVLALPVATTSSRRWL